jgi:hypothetical protein
LKKRILMVHLNFPETELRIRTKSDASEVFDPLRRKFVVLTEEERVRQYLIQYLHIDKKVPMHMMASERGLVVNNMAKRFDLVVFGTSGHPLMIIECKAPHIAVNEDVFYQAARYNLALQVKYLLITNGIVHHCVSIDYTTGETRFLEDIPEYKEL